MNTLLIKWLSFIILFLPFSAQSQNLTWPILQSDDPTDYYKANCTFCEIHGGGTWFHQGIDINVSNTSVPVRPVADGVVSFKQGSDLVIQHNLQNNIVRYTKIREFSPSSNLSVGSSVTAGVTILGYTPVVNGHLHIELSYYENGVEFKINPLNNSLNWYFSLPTNHPDTYDPQINNVFIVPLANEPNSQNSGFEIKATNGSITNYTNSSARIHLENWDATSTVPIYSSQNNKLIVYGTLGIIANARDKGINTVPGPGTSSDNGLTVRKIEYFVDYNQTTPPLWGNLPKYQLEFDRLNYNDRNRIDWVFNTNNTQLSPVTQMFGNDDYIKMFTNENVYVWPQRPINGIQSNGKWYTKIKSTSGHILSNTPTFSELASINSQAKYSDGFHAVRFVAVDASGRDVEHSIEFIIDNFRPYISRVKIYEGPASNWVLKYDRGWQWANNSLQLEPQPNTAYFSQTQDVKVSITTSEPMLNVTLKVGNMAQQTLQCGTDLNKTNWEFIVPIANSTAGEKQFTISGNDLANNPIQSNPGIIPIRQSNTTWTPTPNTTSEDTYHKIIYGGNGIDFIAKQKGNDYNLIEFTDKSSGYVMGSSWKYGDNTPDGFGDIVTHKYSTYGVYNVTHGAIVNGMQGSFSKPVSVNNLSAPDIKNIYSMPKFGNGKSINTLVKVDFFSDCEGIIGTYTWKLDGAFMSSDANPVGIDLVEGVCYTVELEVTNAAGHSIKSEQVCIDPTVYPYANILDWEVTYFVHDLEISTDNFNETDPIVFTIDYGDGIIETYTEDYKSYHTFTHNYYELGEYIVKATITQEPHTVVRTARQIRVQPYDLDVSINYESLHTPAQPKEKIVCSATVTGGASGCIYSGSWGVYRFGDPNSYHTTGFLSSQVPDFEFTPDIAGDYRIMLDVNVSGYPTSGHAGQKIEVENAPKYVDANISSDSYLLSLNSEYSLFGSVWPTGDPGVPEEDWNPTNIRWTLKGPQTNIVEDKTFPYDVYYFAQYFTHKFEHEGMYTLQLETWNKEHQYSVDDLDTSNNCRLSYYNYIIKEIHVSANIPSLKIVDPLSCYIQANRDAEVHDIIISNPSSTPINWNAEVQYINQSNWLHISITSGVSLCCANQQPVVVAIDANSGEGSRYGSIKITGKDSDGNEVQGSPSYVQIGQYGIAGPPYDIVEGTYPDLKFGSAVAIDGRTAVVGSPNSSNIKGQAYIYSKSDNGEWDRISVLLSSDNNSEFGSYVDISGDYASVLGSDKAYFFSKGNSEWGAVTSEFKSQPVNGPKSLTMWGDYVVVGSPFYNSDRGKVTIFYRNQGGVDNWGIAKELNGDNAGDKFGYSVDLYNDRLVVGAPKGGQGYMKIFNRNLVSGNDWGLEQKIVAPGFNPGESGTSDFGKAVTIFQDNVSTTYYRYCEPGSGGAMYYGPVLFSITYFSSEIGNWEEVVRQIVQDRPAGNNVTSGTLFKLKDPIENEESFISGFGYPIQEYVLVNGTDGSFGSVLVTKAKCMGPWDYCDFDNLQSQNPYTPNSDEKYGSSVSFSYAGNVTGISGYDSPTANNVGGAIFDYNNYLGNNLCEAGIDLNLINFTKPSGTYPDVIARNICLGGRALQATIENGAKIKYEAKEILLQDGFLADNGSNFTAQAQNCETSYPDSPGRKVFKDSDLSQWPLSEQARTQLLKVYMRVYPDFPWETFDLGNAVDFMKPETKSTVYQNSKSVDKSVQRVGFNEPVMSELPVLLLNNAEIKLGLGKIKKSTKNSN